LNDSWLIFNIFKCLYYIASKGGMALNNEVVLADFTVLLNYVRIAGLLA